MAVPEEASVLKVRRDATHPRHKPLLNLAGKAWSNAMADHNIQHLMNAREALVTRRLTLAQTIAAPGDIPEETRSRPR